MPASAGRRRAASTVADWPTVAIRPRLASMVNAPGGGTVVVVLVVVLVLVVVVVGAVPRFRATSCPATA